MRRSLVSSVLLVSLVCLGCNSNTGPVRSEAQKQEDANAAVKAGIEKYLKERSGLNLNAMTWELKEVKFEGEKATANVHFVAKEGGGEMTVPYTLQKTGAEWVVQKQPASGQSPH